MRRSALRPDLQGGGAGAYRSLQISLLATLEGGRQEVAYAILRLLKHGEVSVVEGSDRAADLPAALLAKVGIVRVTSAALGAVHGRIVLHTRLIGQIGGRLGD